MAKCARLSVALSLSLIAVAGCGIPPGPSTGTDLQAVTSALTTSIQNDFEDGTTQGWGPFGSPTVANSTEAAFSGTHSLKTTNRTSGFMGPSISLTNQLAKGATYKVSVAARLAPGEVPTTLRVTVMRTLTDGTSAFDTVVGSTNATADSWVVLTGNYSFSTAVNGLTMYVESASATASYYIDAFSLTQTTPAPLSWDFEDGTTQGWGPFGSPTVANSTDFANTGTHSLKTTNRTSGFMGPSINLQGQLTKGATYQVTLSARLVAGGGSATIQPTMMRTPTGGSAAFDSVGSATVTETAWTTINAIYSFSTDNSGLTFYVQSSSATASYYIDTVSITQVAPPPGPPGNTTGATSTFESNTLEGWKARTGAETVAVSTADAHGGTYSLLTTNRTATYMGPAFDVTNVMFNGSRYIVSVWAKLAPGSADTQLRVSLDRKLGTATETFHTVVGNTTVTQNAWVRLQATYDQALANSSLVLYVESASGTPSFYIDDFSITYQQPAVAERDIPSVFQSMAAYFPVGAAVIPADIQGEPGVLLAKHFNSITSGNDMKWDATEPTEGHFSYTNADAQVSFAKTNGMRVRGHTLVWHNQTPAWVFNDASGNPMTPTPDNKALLIQRIQNHIAAVVGHFGSDVTTWDVVNEVVDPSQPDGYRRSTWYNIIGPSYIDVAFQAARAANPTAKLYINDYDTTNPVKRDFLLGIVRDLKSRGIPVDGVGHQMHDNIEYPSPQSVIDAVNLFNAAGVDNSVTEMDVSIYSGSFPTPFTSYTDIPQSRHNQVGYSYLGFVNALKSLQGKIASVTIWGTSDDKTWLNSSTKIDAPLLFDPSLKKKPAYWAFVDPLQLPGADLSAALTAAPSGAAAGQAVAYTITVTNNGDHDTQSYQPSDDDLPATNVTMSMTIPSHTGFQAITPPAGWVCATPPVGASGQVTCTVGSLAVNASAQVALMVAVNDCSTADGSTIMATASVTSSTADPNPAPNNSASASVQVSNPPPVITANGALDTTLECATPYVDAGATAQDMCQGAVAVTTSSNVNASAVGTYTVGYDAVDAAGSHAAPVVRTVQVVDTTAPVLTVLGPNPAAVECTAAFTDPGATASDSCAGMVPVATMGVVDVTTPGNYALGYTATDPSGNSTAAIRSVTVADTTAPAIELWDLTVLAPGLKVVLDEQNITVSGRAQGRHGCGNLSILGDDITFDGTQVRIHRQPVAADGRTIVLLPPNHDYHTFTVADLVEAVTDACDSSLGLAGAVITQITSDEAEDGKGKGGGDGHTLNDVVIAPDCKSANLRIERDGGGNGRVYTVSLRVKDASGNATTTQVQVMIPADGNGASAIDDGAAYTVASACR
jgi:endo-1,4-beta-xylanase